MNTQICDKFRVCTSGITNAIKCLKDKYDAYKASDYRMFRRKFNVEYSLYKKNTPETPLSKAVFDGEAKLSVVDILLIVGAWIALCHLIKAIHCRFR